MIKYKRGDVVNIGGCKYVLMHTVMFPVLNSTPIVTYGGLSILDYHTTVSLKHGWKLMRKKDGNMIQLTEEDIIEQEIRSSKLGELL